MYKRPASSSWSSTISAAVTRVSSTPISETWFGVTWHQSSTVATGVTPRSKSTRT